MIFKLHRLRKLDQKIADRERELIALSNIIGVERQKAVNGLTDASNDALDVYQNSSIMISNDIIEELARQDIVDMREAFNFIESQRTFWKYENMKKPFKKGWK